MNGIVSQERQARGHTEYYLQRMVRYKGKRKNVFFFIGTDTTWTEKRERKAWRAARKFDREYRKYMKHGGVHPCDRDDLKYSVRG